MNDIKVIFFFSLSLFPCSVSNTGISQKIAPEDQRQMCTSNPKMSKGGVTLTRTAKRNKG